MSFLRKLFGEPKAALDPSVFNDPVAEQIPWTPLKRGGTSFQTKKLNVISSGASGRAEFVITGGYKAFCFLFILFGMFIAAGVIGTVGFEDGSFVYAMLIPAGMGLIFSLTGFIIYYFSLTPIVFDKREGYFWKGRKSPSEVFNIDRIKHRMKLDDVHAIQLISERVSSNNGSYRSYEVNLVSSKGERVNVIDHGKLSTIREDADTLSKFLNVPVWDGI
ncbi:MAG: hypothetical protein AAF363_02150 [Bacteroidota bacterium]